MAGQRARTIVVVGSRAAGKTSVVHRLIDEPTDFTTYRPTIDECYNITWKLPDSKPLQVQVIDTAAWNEFPAMQSLFVKMSHLVLVVYDVTQTNATQHVMTLITEVRDIKPGVDILVIGNKCDKLTRKDKFMPTNLTETIGPNCVGHVYTSAKSEQGIVGLKQLILCTKSQLTDGYYTEPTQMPKRKKLHKKLHGMAINLHKKKGKQEVVTPNASRKCSTLPKKEIALRHSNATCINIENSFAPIQTAPRHSLDARLPEGDSLISRSPNGTLDVTQQRLAGQAWPSTSSLSDYSSPGTSPMLGRHLLQVIDLPPRRKSMDFSKLELVSDPLVHKSKLARKKSMSCSDDHFLSSGSVEEPFTQYKAGKCKAVRRTENNNITDSSADNSDSSPTSSPSSLSTLMNFVTGGNRWKGKMGKSSDHLDNLRISNFREFSKHHGSADDLLNVNIIRQ